MIDVIPQAIAAIGSGGLVGFTLGLIGGGGSILATPLLLYVVGISQPHIAIGTGALAVWAWRWPAPHSRSAVAQRAASRFVMDFRLPWPVARQSEP